MVGDTAPNAEAGTLQPARVCGNINGGDTSISTQPVTHSHWRLGIKEGYLQVYAPITNENIYTNLWTGPFYGFERAIETMERPKALAHQACGHLLPPTLGLQTCGAQSLAQGL